MLFRRLVTSWLQQTVRERIYEAVSESQRGSPEPRRGHEAPAQNASSREELPPCKLAFVVASTVEAGGLVDLLRDLVTTRGPTLLEHSGYLNGQRVVLIESGTGYEAAERAARDLIAVHHPKWVICAGFAAALSEDMRRGHFLMADEVADPNGNCLPIGLNIDRRSIEESPTLHIGRLLSTDQLVRTSAEKRALAQQHGALACDMETAAVAQVCRDTNAYVLSIRIINEAVDDQMPQEVERWLDTKTLAGKLGIATGAIFRKPSSVKEMWKLTEDAIKASDRLASFLASVAARLEDSVSEA